MHSNEDLFDHGFGTFFGCFQYSNGINRCSDHFRITLGRYHIPTPAPVCVIDTVIHFDPDTVPSMKTIMGAVVNQNIIRFHPFFKGDRILILIFIRDKKPIFLFDLGEMTVKPDVFVLY